MKRHLFLPLMLATIALAVSCHKQPIVPTDENRFDGLQVPATFDWSTTKTIQTSISSAASRVIKITSADGSIVYHTGYYNHLSDFYNPKVVVPSWVEELSVNGMVSPVVNNTLTLDLDAVNQKNSSGLAELPDGLVSWWKLDELDGNTVADHNNLNNGTLSGALHQTGISGNALFLMALMTTLPFQTAVR